MKYKSKIEEGIGKCAFHNFTKKYKRIQKNLKRYKKIMMYVEFARILCYN